MTTTNAAPRYAVIPAFAAPSGGRWDVPARYQGQIVEYAWHTYSRAEAGDDELYMRVTDRSSGVVTYYRRAGGV